MPVSQAENFAAKLHDSGVYAELLRLKVRGHIGAYLIDSTAIEGSIEFLTRKLATTAEGGNTALRSQ